MFRLHATGRPLRADLIAREKPDRNGTGGPDPGVPPAADAADARQPADRARAAGSLRRRDPGRCAGAGEIARRVPRGWIECKSRRPSVATVFRSAGTAADRRRSGPCQFRANIARLAVSHLGMDQSGSAADDGARLCQRGEQADRLRQSTRGPAGRRHVPDQGGQIPGEHAGLAGRHPSGPGQARDLYDRAFGRSRPDQDPLRDARARCAGQIQRCPSGQDRGIQRYARRQSRIPAEAVRKEATPMRCPLRWHWWPGD